MKKRDRLKLYPRHQHEWTDADVIAGAGRITNLVTCTVCGFQAPRNAAGLDGRMPQEPYHPPRPAHCPICSPEQETR